MSECEREFTEDRKIEKREKVARMEKKKNAQNRTRTVTELVSTSSDASQVIQSVSSMV